jgi:hypothetical protein
MTTSTNNNNNNNDRKISVPDEIVRDVLLKLDQFEEKQKYLSNRITLSYLARDFNTIMNYLSKIITIIKTYHSQTILAF